MDREDNTNFILTLVISMAVLIGWNYFFDATPIKSDPKAQTKQVAVNTANTAAAAISEQTNADMFTPKADLSTSVSRDDLIRKSPRVALRTKKLSGTIRLIGARIDDVTLNQYSANQSGTGEKVRVFNPQLSKNAYYADFGWLSVDRSQAVPSENTRWQASQKTLSHEKPLVLTWSNGTGITFIRTISVDDKYLFTVTDTIRNTSDKPAQFQQYSLIRRHGTPDVSNYMAVHEGVVGYLDGKLREVKYADISEKGRMEFRTKSGWFGFTDKYWLTSVIADPKSDQPVTFRHSQNNSDVRYQVDTLGGVLTLAPGARVSTKSHVFVGPKELSLLDGYEEQLKIDHFDLAVDFGWFYFITKPFFHILSLLRDVLGSFAAAILALTVLLKLVFLPLANKSYRSMGKMKELQPKIEALKAQYGKDTAGLNQAMMEMYKREKVNPMGGCLPMIIQIPFFFAMYKVLFISIEMRHAPFWGWIHDLSAPDPTNVFTLFGLIPWDPPSFLMIGVWPVIMGVTMLLQQRMNPAPTDPIQEKMFMLMPVMFTYMLAQFPAGLVIYWAWNNVLTMLQQWYIMNQNKKIVAVSAPKAKAKPKSPKKK